MVVARKRLALPLKKVVTVTAPSPKITPTTQLQPTTAGKQTPHSAEVTGDIARPMKLIKKKAKKKECDIFVISSQEIRTSTPDAPHPTSSIEVPTRTLQKSSTPNVDQMALIQPMVQAPTMVELVVASLVQRFVAQTSTVPSIDISDIDPEIIILEEATTVLAEVTHSSNPKIINILQGVQSF